MSKSLTERVLAGDERAAGRLMRLVDDGADAGLDAIEKLHEHTGSAYIVGITGNPGSGKSTLVDQLIHKIRENDQTVGVVAIDPTSPFSGGSILGDRVRMNDHATDRGVFIRSVATRGNLGGVSRSTPALLHVLDAMGFDWIIVETVGVGQDEVDIAAFADTCVVITVPGLGDEIQAAKAGILEVAHIFVVNKSDRPGAGRVKRELENMMNLDPQPRDWRPPVVETVATDGTGVDDLLDAIVEHRRESSATRDDRRAQRDKHLTRLVAAGEATRKIDEFLRGDRWVALEERIEAGEISPFRAARVLLETLGLDDL